MQKNFSFKHKLKGVDTKFYITGMLLLAVLLAALTFMVPKISAAAFSLLDINAAVVGGTVFRDINADGTQDAGEFGLSGVKVTVIDATTTVTTTTDIDGNWAIDGSSGITGAIRVEFDESSTTLQPGTAGGTTAQFSIVPDTTMSTGFTNPAQFCEENPKLITPQFTQGDPTSADWAPMAALSSWDYSSPSGADNHATFEDLGATWGLAYQRSSEALFVSAVMKRHSGYGPQGTGGIYAVDPTVTSAPYTVNNLINLNGQPDPTNGGVISTTAVITGHIGLSTSNEWPMSSNPPDNYAFPASGKESIGDIDISDDGNTLYAVSLHDKKLVLVDVSSVISPSAVGTPAVSSAHIIPAPPAGCTNGEQRPWGIKVFDGVAYVGVVCDAGAVGGTAADLSAHVYQFDGTDFTEVLSTTLDYNRTAGGSRTLGWEPWTDTYPTLSGDYWDDWAQPILADIEFDEQGNMFLGFVDRFALQAGNGQRDLITSVNQSENATAAGDLLKACKIGDNQWAIEDGQGGTDCPADTTASRGDAQHNGPSGGEFFINESENEDEAHLGSLAILFGSGDLVATVSDPNGGNSAGIVKHGLDDGTGDNRFVVVSDTAFHRLAKGLALGDIELICDTSAPLEIGNRVWNDADGDGVQDPGEVPLPGVEVNLYRDNGDGTYTLVGTSTTDVDGQFLFNAASVTLNGANDVEPNTTYVIRIDVTTPITDAGLTHLSPPNSGSNDLHDSDGTKSNTMGLAESRPEIVVTTGGTGANNHRLDFGFNAVPTAVNMNSFGTGQHSDMLTVLATVSLLIVITGAGLWFKRRNLVAN